MYRCVSSPRTLRVAASRSRISSGAQSQSLSNLVRRFPRAILSQQYSSSPICCFSSSSTPPKYNSKTYKELLEENARLKKLASTLEDKSGADSALVRVGLRTFTIIEIFTVSSIFILVAMYMYGLLKDKLPEGKTFLQHIMSGFGNAFDRYSDDRLRKEDKVTVVHYENEDDFASLKRIETIIDSANLQSSTSTSPNIHSDVPK